MTDAQLLQVFLEQKSQSAFTEFVGRHVDWVYFAARRQVVDPALAEDVTQAVFILAAEKAGHLAGHPRINGWLFRATRFCASNGLQQQAHRRRHEKEAGAMRMQESAMESTWEALAPGLEGAMARLGASDREALLLRFYRSKSMAEVAAALGIGEEAAKKRIQRAVEKLRGTLGGEAKALEGATLAALLSGHVTQQAPAALAGKAALVSAKSGSAAVVAKAAGGAMGWAKLQIAAGVLVAAGVTGGIGYEAIAHRAGAGGVGAVAAAPAVPLSAPALPAIDPAPVAAEDFDGLYEKALGSAPDLTMTAGPNTFAVTAVMRYNADGKGVATDGRGKRIDSGATALGAIAAAAGAGVTRDVVLVALSPAPARYDIDRLRIFDHAKRRYIRGVAVTQLPGTSVLQITALPGTLPAKLDLWLAVSSYDGASTVVSLPAVKTATVLVGGSTVGFVDLRDGQWNYQVTGFRDLNAGTPGEYTSLQLQSLTPWTAGRYQFAAVTKDHRKYLSDFFVDFHFDERPILFIPLGLGQIDHLELRPTGHQRPFYFDGVALPPVTLAPGPENFPAPVVVQATGARTALPAGGSIELVGIAHHPPMDGKWWGIDGKAVQGPAGQNHSEVTVDKEHQSRELLACSRGVSRERSDVLWDIDGGGGWAGGGDGKTSRIVASLPRGAAVTIRIGVPATGWQTVEEIPIEKLPLELASRPGVVGALAQQDQGVRLTLKGVEMIEGMRVVLVDHAGKVHTHTEWEGSVEDKLPPWGAGPARLTFSPLSLENVEMVRLESRPIEYVEFRDVPMEPR